MIFRREPALLIELLKAVLVLVSVTVIPGLTADTQATIIVVATGAAGLATAVFVRPLEVPLIAEAIKTIAVGLGAWGLNLAPEQLATVVILVGAVLTTAERNQVTPVAA